MIRLTKIAMLAALISVTSCANLNSIHHRFELENGEPRIISMDARQRTVIVNPIKGGNLRICAEQFPDVFTVLSASIAGGGGFNLGGSNREARADIAGALSETGSNISRTQTVNLLRESMYRTCERYMNGALDQNAVAVQANRDLRAMVAVLAIEQLTGVVTPAPVVLSTQASAEFTEDRNNAVEALEAAKKKADDARKTLETATVDLVDKGGTVADGCKNASEDQKVECAAAETQYSAAKETLTREEAQLTSIQKASALPQIVTVKADASSAPLLLEGGEGRGGGPENQVPASTNNSSLSDRAEVAQAVVDIVRMTVNHNQGASVCETILLSQLAPRTTRQKTGDGERVTLITTLTQNDSTVLKDIVNQCFELFARNDRQIIFASSNVAVPESFDNVDVDFIVESSTPPSILRSMIAYLNFRLPSDFFVWDVPSIDPEYSYDEGMVYIEYYDSRYKNEAVHIYKEFLAQLPQANIGCRFSARYSSRGGIGDIDIYVPNGDVLELTAQQNSTVPANPCD